jgi:hypothetical protein
MTEKVTASILLANSFEAVFSKVWKKGMEEIEDIAPISF